MNEQLDPSVVALAQSISKAETGGSANPYTTSGASGEYGAYQYTAPTWEADSQKYLGQAVPLDQATPAQQDEVAYDKIKDLGSQGYTPAQIASIWNSGKPDPTGNVGVNKFGVAYNTPAYVQKVESYYNQQTQGLQKPPAQTDASAPIAPPSSGYQPPTPPGQTQAPTQNSGSEYTPPAPPPTPTATQTSQPQTQSGMQFPGSQYGNNALNWGSSSMPTGGIVQGLGALIAKYTTPGMGLGGVAGTPAAQNVQFPSAEQVGGSALQTGGDIAALASAPFTGGLSTAGLIGTGAAMGAAQTAGGAMQQNASASQVGQQGAIGGAIGAATSGILSLVSNALGSLAAKSVTSAIRPNASDFSDGYDAQFAVDNGLTGNASQVAEKTKTFMGNLTDKLQSILGSSDSGIDLSSVYDKTVADLTPENPNETTSNLGILRQGFGQAKQIQNALQNLQDNVLVYNPSGNMPLPAAQVVKQSAGMFGEWANGVRDPDANALATVYNNFYTNLKSAIEDATPEGEVADINSQLQDAIPILRAAIRRIPVDARAGALSLPDMLGILGFIPTGGVSAAIPAVTHLMNTGAMSNIAPTIAGAIPGATPAISAAAPGLLGRAFPSLGLQQGSTQ